MDYKIIIKFLLLIHMWLQGVSVSLAGLKFPLESSLRLENVRLFAQ